MLETSIHRVLPGELQAGRYRAELQSLRSQGVTTGDESLDRQLLGLSYEFEKMMLSQMMKSMRGTVQTEGLFGGQQLGGGMFREMLDSEFVEQTKGNLPLGLAGTLYRQLVELQGAGQTGKSIPAAQAGALSDTGQDNEEAVLR